MKIFLITFMVFFASITIGENMHNLPEINNQEEIKETKLTETFILETLTIYHAVESQCDSDPLITASCKKINKDKLYHGQLKWMALSRDMLSRWGGKINYGDTINIMANDSTIDGKWIIQDTMNKRYKNRGDLLFHEKIRKTGKWKNVKFIKI